MGSRHDPITYYKRLYKYYGPRHWWPADSPLEVILGAILTQNTAWRNVERAIEALKKHQLMSLNGMRRVPIRVLAQIIRPAGYFNIKAARLKSFIRFVDKEYQGRLSLLLREEASQLRKKLLGVNGIGPETADSILLYAADQPFFVIDAYTRRVFERHRLVDSGANYDQLQAWFMRKMKRNTKLYNEFHALIVQVGKDYCRRTPLCQGCPLEPLLRGSPGEPAMAGSNPLVFQRN